MEWDDLDIFDDNLDSRAKPPVLEERQSMKGFGSSRRSSALFRQDKRPKCDASEVALSESPLIKPKQQANDSFEGFSIVKNRVPSALSSPFSKSEELIRHMLPRPRSSSNGRLFSSTAPQSPQEYHTPMSYPADPEKFSSQLAVLKDELKDKDEEIRRLKAELAAANAATQAAQEDANANKFMCSLQEQRIEELEQQSSRDRLDRNEALSDKTRKHKQVIKKLNQDRAAYEERADKMIKQMNEQMTQLQQMAMSRIETLENDLLAQRHSNDKLQAECTRLHACAAAAMASATKHRQLATALKGSPSVKKHLFSPNGTLRAMDAHRYERHSSIGTSSSYASTELHDDGGNDAEEDDLDGENDGAESGTEVDENESCSNTPLASPASSPSVDKLGKLAFSPSVTRQGSCGLEEEVWSTQI